MQIVDYTAPKFDASEFVSYMSEDLTTPTERELNEELPEWKHREAVQKKIEEKASKPRRGVGFLRAEDSPEVDFPDPILNSEIESSFGEGINDSEITAPARRLPTKRPARLPADAGSGGQESSGSQTDQGDGDEGKGPGRKRRRRRGRRSKSPGGADTSTADTSPSGIAAAAPSGSESSVSDSPESQGAADNAAPDKEGTPAGKRKPRNRRRRRRGPKLGGESSPLPSGD